MDHRVVFASKRHVNILPIFILSGLFIKFGTDFPLSKCFSCLIALLLRVAIFSYRIFGFRILQYACIYRIKSACPISLRISNMILPWQLIFLVFKYCKDGVLPFQNINELLSILEASLSYSPLYIAISYKKKTSIHSRSFSLGHS